MDEIFPLLFSGRQGLENSHDLDERIWGGQPAASKVSPAYDRVSIREFEDLSCAPALASAPPSEDENRSA